MGDWKSFSKKLDEDVKARELFEALLAREERTDEEVLREKRHWWDFLSREVVGVPAEELRRKARKIKETSGSEMEYCHLLKRSFELHLISNKEREKIKELFRKNLKLSFHTDPFTIRWIYIYQLRDEKKPNMDRANMFRTVKDKYDREVPIEKLFKSACLINRHIKNGTPDHHFRELKELIPVDISELVRAAS